MDTSTLNLPDEIIELILSRCPAESVGRFKSVSKSWQSIISSPRFCRIHHIQQSKLPENQNMFLFWMQESQDSNARPVYMILKYGKFKTVDPMDDPCRGFYPLSSCDGLILLSCDDDDDDDDEEYMLWNPVLGEDIIIPAYTPERHPEAFRNRPHDELFHLWLHHLYYDSTTNDYKILLGYKNWYNVYSCQNGIWGDINDICVDLDLSCTATCVDGCIYRKRNGQIVCFDTRDGKLHKCPQPNDVEGFVLTGHVPGRLCLEKRSEDGRRVHLWVMEESGSFKKCWRKLINMEKEEAGLWELSVECFTNEDDVVLTARFGQEECEGSLYKYNPRQYCFQEFEFADEYYYHNASFPFPYSENLYLPSSNMC